MRRLMVGGLAAWCAATAAAGSNVTAGVDVQVLAGSVNGAELSTLVDGVFLPHNTNWQDGTVWWDDGATGHTTIQFSFGLSLIRELTVQADDNDAYRLSYMGDDNAWHLLWDIPNYDQFGSGMQTRPDPENDSARFTLPVPVMTSMLLFEGVDGDSLYSVSEVAAFGDPAPAPASLALLGAGCLTLRRRR